MPVCFKVNVKCDTRSFQSGNKLFNVLKVFIKKKSDIFKLLHVYVHAICLLLGDFSLQDLLASK